MLITVAHHHCCSALLLPREGCILVRAGAIQGHPFHIFSFQADGPSLTSWNLDATALDFSDAFDANKQTGRLTANNTHQYPPELPLLAHFTPSILPSDVMTHPATSVSAPTHPRTPAYPHFLAQTMSMSPTSHGRQRALPMASQNSEAITTTATLCWHHSSKPSTRSTREGTTELF